MSRGLKGERWLGVLAASCISPCTSLSLRCQLDVLPLFLPTLSVEFYKITLVMASSYGHWVVRKFGKLDVWRGLARGTEYRLSGC
jgi:hypothetical protein